MKTITYSEGRTLCLYNRDSLCGDFSCEYNATMPMNDGPVKTELFRLAHKVLDRCEREGRGLVHFRKFDSFPTNDGIGFLSHDLDSGVCEITVSFAIKLTDCTHDHRHTFTVEAE